MIRSFNKILNEAIYSQRKMFYHISYNNFSKFRNENNFRKDDKNMSGTFLTPSMAMIKFFLYDYLIDKYGVRDYYLYRCKLIKDLNIFNPSNKEDQKKFITEVEKDPKRFYELYASKSHNFVHPNLADNLIKYFKDNDWYNAENPAISSIIKKLGYDGFESTEQKVTNILVFNSSNIDIIDSGPYKVIHANSKTELKKFFDENDPEVTARIQLDNNRRGRGNVGDYSQFAKYELDDIFGISKKINDDEIGFTNISNYFDRTGKLVISKLFDDLAPWFKDIKPWESVEYDGYKFMNWNTLIEYLKTKFDSVIAEDEDYEDDTAVEDDDDDDIDVEWDEEEEDI